MEQITYLLFIRRLDDLQTLEENKANRLGKPIERAIFPEGKDPRSGRTTTSAGRGSRTSRPAEMFRSSASTSSRSCATLGGDDSTYAHHMRDARFTIPTPALLAKVVDLLDHVPMEDRDTKGDVYEYMLGKIATAGQNGQFRTPRHIIRLMVEMIAPDAERRDLRPGLRHCGFLVAAGEYLREHHPEMLRDAKLQAALPRGHVPRLRLRQHDAAHRQHEHAAARRRESGHPLQRLARPGARRRGGAYTLVLANPPFAGSLDYENIAKDLLQSSRRRRPNCSSSPCSSGC